MNHFETMQKLGLRSISQGRPFFVEENHNPRQPSQKQLQKCQARRGVEAYRERRAMAEELGLSVAELKALL